MLPRKPSDPGRTAEDQHLFAYGCMRLLHSADHSLDLPQRCGKWKTLQKRLSRWSQSGIWDEVFAARIKDRNHPDLKLETILVHADLPLNRWKGLRHSTLHIRWADVAQDWAQSPGIVEALDILEQIPSGVIAGGVDPVKP